MQQYSYTQLYNMKSVLFLHWLHLWYRATFIVSL